MSDYFGALMRSSGVSVADAARPLPSYRDMPGERQPGDPRLGEQIATPFALDRESSVAPPAVTPTPATRSVDATVASDPSARTAATPIKESDPAEQTDAVVESADPTIAAMAQSDSSAPAVPREHVTASEPVSAQSLTRAVLRWVASDPAQVSQSPQIVTSREQTPAAPSQVVEAAEATTRLPSSSRPAQEPAARALTFPREQHAITTEPAGDATNAPFEPVDEPIARAEPARSNHATLLPAAPFSPSMSAHEEVIEVSIGAVHVRVDAPPELAVSRAPAAPPARAATPGQRSSLARRALRRV